MGKIISLLQSFGLLIAEKANFISHSSLLNFKNPSTNAETDSLSSGVCKTQISEVIATVKSPNAVGFNISN